MSAATTYPFYELIDLLVETAPERVLNFRASEKITQRVYELIEKEKNNQITREERAELDRFMLEEDLISIAKARAQLRLLKK
jgi:hypothetical protein